MTEIVSVKCEQIEIDNNIEKEFAEMRLIEKIQNSKQLYTVHGIYKYNDETNERELVSETDLDGKSALGLLSLAGANICNENVVYVYPGESLSGAINVDTGCVDGFIYNADNDTVVFDHHDKESGNDSSATEKVYQTLVDLKLIDKTETLDRVVDFVNKIDNRKYPTEEFLNSSKTILGLQRDVNFPIAYLYFCDHEGPNDLLTTEELEKYDLSLASEKQQEIIDESIEKLIEMEASQSYFIGDFGQRILINKNNELKVGSSAAYLKFDGILNITPGKSFALTLKNGNLDEDRIRERFGDDFVGKFIRGNMWIYNESEPLKLTTWEIVDKLASSEYRDRKLLLSEVNEIISKGEYSCLSDLMFDYGNLVKENCGESDKLKNFIRIQDIIRKFEVDQARDYYDNSPSQEQREAIIKDSVFLFLLAADNKNEICGGLLPEFVDYLDNMQSYYRKIEDYKNDESGDYYFEDDEL